MAKRSRFLEAGLAGIAVAILGAGSLIADDGQPENERGKSRFVLGPN